MGLHIATLDRLVVTVITGIFVIRIVHPHMIFQRAFIRTLVSTCGACKVKVNIVFFLVLMENFLAAGFEVAFFTFILYSIRVVAFTVAFHVT